MDLSSPSRHGKLYSLRFGSAIFRAMSQPNAGEKKTRGKQLGDRILRSFGIAPRRSSQIVSTTTTGASSLSPPAPKAMQSPQQSGNNSSLQFRKLVPVMTIPESLGGPGVEMLVPAPPPIVRNPAPPPPSPVTLAPQAGTMSEKNKAGGLWARALERLCIKDKNTLETNETRSTLDIEELLLAVQAKREMCLENQWRFAFHGRAVNLRYQADKIISWLAKFKEVGDIAIQQDPSHAALPWAGIRFLLQVGMASFFRVEC